MSQKLPSNFDAERYAAAYPDVALTGLAPAEHYRRFGRLMGRSPVGKPDAPGSAAAGSPRKEPEAQPIAAQSKAAGERRPSVKNPPSPIVDRPPDFDATAAIPSLPGPKAGANSDGFFTLAAIAGSPFASPEQRTTLCAPLGTYARMLSLPDAGVPEFAEIILGTRHFRNGPTRIENAWFAASTRLRLMIGGSVEESPFKGSAVRAYQAVPAAPGELKLLGDGVQLPADGPVFHDFELLDPLMPLLLELSDIHGTMRDIALMPFPSLLPGGLHGAELKALYDDANPIDAFWHLCEQLLRELIGRADSRARSIADLAIAPPAGAGAPLGPLAEVRDWLSVMFGLSLAENAERKGSGLCLVLPADSLPTISALVSRRLEMDRGTSAVGPYLVADSEGQRPRWLVALPSSRSPDPSLPFLSMSGRRTKRQEQPPKPIPIPVAIAFRDPPSPELSSASGGEASPSMAGHPLTAIVDGSESTRIETVVRALEAICGDSLQLIVHPRENRESISATLNALRGCGGWAAIEGDFDLTDFARSSERELILTISDRVEPTVAALHTLAELLREDERAASASCVLLGQTVLKKRAVLQPGTGGLFPARVSFASSPRLGFFEPDVLQALPNLTYRVVANSLLFTIWRTRALAELPCTETALSDEATDIRIGLDLIAGGFHNLCTSKIAARTSGPWLRRDAIDPIGARYLQPARWEDLLSRVTVVRELF